MPNLERIVRKAWRETKEGETRQYGNHTVHRARKMLIVVHGSYEEKTFERVKRECKKPHFCEPVQIVAYPHPKHLRTFKEAQRGLHRAGPADTHPGSVGSIEAYAQIGDNGKREFRVQHIQSHFSTTNTTPLPRQLATHYMGWRPRTMAHLLQLARELKMPLVVPRSKLYPQETIGHRATEKTPAHKELLALCKEHGFSMSRVAYWSGAFTIKDKQKSEKKRRRE
ncbi:MAG: hypothetical protein V1722_05725 [Candidatus Micrarchaeota archaeon]